MTAYAPPIRIQCAYCTSQGHPCDCGGYIEWVRACADDGCEASAREMEELLDELENPADDGPLPIRFCLTDAELLAHSLNHRRFNREHRVGGRV